MADITKSTVSFGEGSIVSKSDTASKAGSDLVTGMADYQNCPMELIAVQGQVPGNQQHDDTVVEAVSDTLGSWELLAEAKATTPPAGTLSRASSKANKPALGGCLRTQRQCGDCERVRAPPQMPSNAFTELHYLAAVLQPATVQT